MSLAALIVLGIWTLLDPGSHGPLAGALVALLAAYGLTPLVRALALRRGALDHPDDRKKHAEPTPRLGGVAVIAAFILGIGRPGLAIGSAVGRGLDPEILALALAALTLMLIGAVDDTRGVAAATRLGVQVVCAIGVTIAGVRLNLFSGPAGDLVDVVLSVLWLVGITNAYNFIDGLDGLATSLGALIALLLAAAAHRAGQDELVAVCCVLAAALAGFLPHNFDLRRPARIFLGDSGSASVGFLLAGLSIKEDWAEGNPLAALATPALIFAILIYDMTQTTVTRIASGRVRSFRQWIDYVGRDHIHHRLAGLLGGPRRALALVLVLSFALGLSALGLHRGAPEEALLFLSQGALILIIFAVIEGAAARGIRDRR
jgi:UDP-GlcNAc:undecaprenyl-phosphate GlcNAc-1-phosphate transferase